MKNIEEKQQAAFWNVISSLNLRKCLPDQVFKGGWRSFLICESDNLFSPSFHEVYRDLLSTERSTVCGMININQIHSLEYDISSAIFLDAETSLEEYDAKLKSGGPALGWIFGVDRFGLSSDKGNWVIYCEKQNDIAIFALRNQDTEKEFALPLRKMNAYGIGSLKEMGSSAPFPFDRLTPSWRMQLSRNYSGDEIA